MALLATASASQLARKEQQLVFLLVRQLACSQSQPYLTGQSDRLWQEVAALDLDPERISWLLYGGQDLHDNAALEALDQGFAASPHRPRAQPRSLFSRQPQRGGGHRNAPRATAPAHQAGR